VGGVVQVNFEEVSADGLEPPLIAAVGLLVHVNVGGVAAASVARVDCVMAREDSADSPVHGIVQVNLVNTRLETLGHRLRVHLLGLSVHLLLGLTIHLLLRLSIHLLGLPIHLLSLHLLTSHSHHLRLHHAFLLKISKKLTQVRLNIRAQAKGKEFLSIE